MTVLVSLSLVWCIAKTLNVRSSANIAFHASEVGVVAEYSISPVCIRDVVSWDGEPTAR